MKELFEINGVVSTEGNETTDEVFNGIIDYLESKNLIFGGGMNPINDNLKQIDENKLTKKFIEAAKEADYCIGRTLSLSSRGIKKYGNGEMILNLEQAEKDNEVEIGTYSTYLNNELLLNTIINELNKGTIKLVLTSRLEDKSIEYLNKLIK